MPSDPAVDDLVRRLNSSARLAEVLYQPAEGILVPTNRECTEFFTAVAALVHSTALSLGAIAALAEEMAWSVQATPTLEALPAAELLVSVLWDDETSARAVRVTINRQAYWESPPFSELDLRSRDPCPGVKCGWYIPPEEVPDRVA